MTEKKQDQASGTGQHNDLDKYHFNIYLKPAGHHKALGNYQYLHQNYGVYKQLEAYQGVFEPENFFTASQMFDKPKSSGITDQNSWGVNPFDLNPFRTNTGSDLFGSTLRPDLDKAHIKTVECMSMFNNGTTVPAHFEFIWFLCKKSTNTSPKNYWQTLNQHLGRDVGFASNPTIALAPSTSMGAIFPATYGESPFAHKEFLKMWKPLFRKSEYIAPGDTKKFLYKIHMNKTLNRETLEQATGVTFDGTQTPTAFRNEFIGGLSICMMVIVRPGIVYLNVSEGFSSCTTGPTETGYVGSYKFSYDALPVSRQSVQVGYPQLVSETYELTSGRIINDVDTAAALTSAVNIANTMLES